MDIQKLFDEMGKGWRAERGLRQMTLGRFIAQLEGLDSSKEIVGLGRLDSYRGYYSDLAFSPIEETRTVGAVLEDCKSALDRTFVGYKGGDFVMDEHTPLFVSSYGAASGQTVMGIDSSKEPFEVITQKEEDA
jgi:hypothetical protein